jgi:hypothetical protein
MLSIDILSRDIAGDISAGESFITLSKFRRDPQVLIDGRARDIAWAYRAIGDGVRGVDGTRVKLEFTIQSGMRVTTPSSITRFVYRQMYGLGAPKAPTLSEAQRTHADTETRLAGVGL